MDTVTDDIKAAMAIRDLMSATIALTELPAAQIAAERQDIELVSQRLAKLLTRAEQMEAA
jgi:hypothetical protein